MSWSEAWRRGFIDRAVMMFLGLVIALGGWLSRPLVTAAGDLAALPGAFEDFRRETNDRLDKMQADIDDARRPDRIFEIAPTSRPIEGHCVAGEPCTFVVLARRFPEALECRIVPEATVYIFYGKGGTLMREVQRLDDEPTRNLGPGWAEVEITVQTPRDFAGDAAFAFRNAYDRCLGPQDLDRVSRESAFIPVRIRAARP